VKKQIKKETHGTLL